MEQAVLFEVRDQVALITLNRPKRHNAINQALLCCLYDHLETVSRKEEIRVAILTGNGKSFCSGIDLEAAVTENLFDPRDDGRDLPDIIAECRKPLIGAINGYAITGGFEIALNCDFLIASEQAFFADTHAKVGIHPGWGMTQLLQQAIGQRRARQMSYTCQPISAQKAFQWGLVNEVVPHEMLLPRARQIAADICAVHQNILGDIQNLIEYRNGTTLAAAYAHEREGFRAFKNELFKR
ncbi:MAG: enoyl-CoA hydratase [Thermodesulfobacteriota bacterium]